MMQTQNRIEWPTLALLVICYGIWSAATFFADTIGVFPAIVLTTLTITLHSSLQHETLHGHPLPNRHLSEALVFPAVGLAIPYQRFKDTHLAHHNNEILTDPYDDPESQFLDPKVWARLPGWLRAVLTMNNVHRSKREYKKARARYASIAKLEGITDDWKYRSRLGGVRVSLAESDYDRAENTAKQVVSATGNNADLANAHVLALTLQAESMRLAGANDRMAEAESLLVRARGTKGAEANTRAEMLVTLGHVYYAQGKLEEARFPYLRVVSLYGNSLVSGAARLNAGQVLIDMSGRLDGKPAEQAKSDKLLLSGIKLLAECITKNRGSGAAKSARSVWKQNKARYDKIR